MNSEFQTMVDFGTGGPGTPSAYSTASDDNTGSLLVSLQEPAEVEAEATADRVELELRIRVIGFDDARGRFIEDTHTIVVSRTGSLIAMKHRVFPADVIRIINLENMEEADFRVVGPSIVTEKEVYEWGIESIEPERNIWGNRIADLLRNKPTPEPGMLMCRACSHQVYWQATLLEAAVLRKTGMIAMVCEQCRKPTYWTYVDPSQRPRAFSTADAVAPPPRVVPIRERAERRTQKRALLKLPVLVRRKNGQTETSNTEDMSKRGLATSLATELEDGEIVTVMVPYHPDATNIPQRAQVVWKDPYPSSGRRWHGFKFVR